MTKITLNDQVYEVPEGLTILQAARFVGQEIPVFCYHERLSIAGNCRMCLVEVEKAPKPVASCATTIHEGMAIRLDSDKATKARKGVLEFLLINHPLDCPICDQGGECDLQDVTMAYGPSTSRYEENKRAVTPKNMGPLIKTAMNRCIHCTRCVRFATEVAGVPELGAIGRGENMEITSYLDQVVTSELSANVIDLCPVGALTSRPYAFQGRPWELHKTDSIDVMDGMGSHIRVDSHRMKVMRVLPRSCDDINEEWLSDRSRYACDGLRFQRLDQPYVRDDKGHLSPTTWQSAFQSIAKALGVKSGQEKTKGSPCKKGLAALAGPLADVETMLVLKTLWQSLGCTLFECRPDGLFLETGNRGAYTFNSTFKGVDQADFCLVIGADLRRDAPLLASRLRQRHFRGGFHLAYLGADLGTHPMTHDHTNLGNEKKVLEDIRKGTHPIVKDMKKARYPMVIVGENAVMGPQGPMVMGAVYDICQAFQFVREDWNGYNFLASSAGLVGGLDIGFAPKETRPMYQELYAKVKAGDVKVVFLYGCDDVDFEKLSGAFVIYMGHHGEKGATHADVILPGAAYTEKEATYVNAEGRAQRTRQAVSPVGQAKVDWQILLDLSDYLGMDLGMQSLEEIRDRMVQLQPALREMDLVHGNAFHPFGSLDDAGLKTSQFQGSQGSFYMTNVIARHSPTMAECEREITQQLLKQVG